jgi:hypothetical protein
MKWVWPGWVLGSFIYPGSLELLVTAYSDPKLVTDSNIPKLRLEAVLPSAINNT